MSCIPMVAWLPAMLFLCLGLIVGILLGRVRSALADVAILSASATREFELWRAARRKFEADLVATEREAEHGDGVLG